MINDAQLFGLIAVLWVVAVLVLPFALLAYMLSRSNTRDRKKQDG